MGRNSIRGLDPVAKSGLKVKYLLIWVCLGAYDTLILNPILPFNFRSSAGKQTSFTKKRDVDKKPGRLVNNLNCSNL